MSELTDYYNMIVAGMTTPVKMGGSYETQKKEENKVMFDKNTRNWAVEVGDATLSEIAQYAAFGFGYKWNVAEPSTKKPLFTNAKFLVFDPINKVIMYANTRDEVMPAVCKIVVLWEDVLNTFKNPPVLPIPEKALNFSSSIKVSDKGHVTITGSQFMLSNTFDDLVKQRNTFLGKDVVTKPVTPEPKQYSRVNFIYTTPTKGRKVRNLLLDKSSDATIEGFDIDDNYTYKMFLRARINGTIKFDRFEVLP